MRRLLVSALVLALGAVTSTPAEAFGDLGHRTVAEIASRHLNPAARKEVERLFGKPADVALREASTRPDELKELPGYGALGPLHYVNMPVKTCVYEAEKVCAKGACVIGALEQFTDKLRTASRDTVRAEAVAWVVHLVGDMHQPLHTIDVDKGGNDYQVQFAGEGSNLHRLWDAQMIGTRWREPKVYADALERAPAKVATGGTPLEWATESCKLVSGMYPAKRTIDDRYVAKSLPTIDARLHAAGLRLAAILNRTLDKPAVPVPYR